MVYRRQGDTFQFEEDHFAKNVQDKGKMFDGVSLLMRHLKTKPQGKSIDMNYYDLFSTNIKNTTDGGEN